MPASIARRLLGENKILGVSASTIEEAKTAKRDGADYIGVGAVFPTSTKQVEGCTGVDRPAAIRREISIPVVAIGGINKSNVGKLYGIDGIAVVSAIMGKVDEAKESRELLSLFKKI
jgi:thiamine-phosphate pyrophosphorylase